MGETDLDSKARLITNCSSYLPIDPSEPLYPGEENPNSANFVPLPSSDDLALIYYFLEKARKPTSVNRTMPVDGLLYPWVGWLSLGYLILFVLGIFGNTSVLTSLMMTLRKRRRHIRSPDSQQTRILMSVIALIVVDMYVLLSLPATISDLFLGNWLFGKFICKFHWMVESSGKFLSILILMTFSYDRYMTVCHPYSRYRIKNPMMTGIILLSLTLGTFIILCPLFIVADVILAPIRVKIVSDEVLYMRYRCYLGFSQKMGLIFTTYACVSGFLLPGFMILFSNITILRKVYKHHQGMRGAHSAISYARVAWYTLGVCSFYAFCWGPFWLTFFLIEFTNFSSDADDTTFLYVMHVLHALPYISSSFNWVFYSLLNKEVQRMKEHALSIGETRENINGSISLLEQ